MRGFKTRDLRRRSLELDRRLDQAARERGNPLGIAAGRVLARPISARSRRCPRSTGPPWTATRSALRKPSARAPTRPRPSSGWRGRGPASAAIRPSLRGETIEIATGRPLPGGADAVVPVESTRSDGDHVLVSDSVPQGRNIGRRGEDIAAGNRWCSPPAACSGRKISAS